MNAWEELRQALLATRASVDRALQALDALEIQRELEPGERQEEREALVRLELDHFYEGVSP